VCVTGRAIYTGDSQLPERLEVVMIEDKATATAAISIIGSMAPAAAGDRDGGFDHVH
jgi:hypothetical protein